MLRNVQITQDYGQPVSEKSCLGADNESDSEDTCCILDRIERRLSMLERVLWAMVQQRQSIYKRRETFDYIESWLSTTTVPRSCSGDTSGKQTIEFVSDLAMEDAMGTNW